MPTVFPIERACRIALREIRDFLQENSGVQEVRVVCFSQSDYQRYLDALSEIEG